MTRRILTGRHKGAALGHALALVAMTGVISSVGYQLLNTSLNGSVRVSASLTNAEVLQHVVNTLASEATADSDGLPLAPAGTVVISGLSGSETPAGGWQIPATSNATKTDAFGNFIGYCAWNHGSNNGGSGYFQGTAANLASAYIAVISPGRDKTFQTNCTHAKAGIANGDDAVRFITAGAGRQIRNGGGTWLDPVDCFDSATPTTDVLGNAANCGISTSRVDLINITGLANGTMVLAKKAGAIYQIYGGSWHQVGGASGGYNAAGFSAASFIPINGANPNTVLESNSVQTSGIGTAILVTVSNGAYAISSDNVSWSAWQTGPGQISNGQYIKLRQTSSTSYSATTTTTINLGGIAKTWNVTTRAADTTPNGFSFTSVTGATASTTYTSNTVTISGIDIPVALSVSGNAASPQCNVNGAGWSACSGTIANNSTLQVRQTSSSSPLTKTDMTVTVGGVSATYSVTTADTVRFVQFSYGDFRGIAVDSAGNAYVTGNSWETSGNNIRGIYTLKLNSLFRVQWHSLIVQDPNIDCCWHQNGLKVGVDSTGNSYVVGDFYRGSYSVPVISYDASGNKRWHRRIQPWDGYTYTGAGGVAVSSSGSVYVLVSDWEQTNNDSIGAVLVKYNSSGTAIWKTRLNNAASPQVVGRAITIDAAENIYISGQASNKLFIAKFSSGGALQWRETTDVPWAGSAGALAIAPSGNIYVGSGISTANGNDALAIKMDSNGAILWQRKFGDGNGNLALEGIALDSSENVYITGGSMAAKLDSSGTLQWMRSLPSQLGAAKAMAYKDGTLFIAAYFGIAKLPIDGSGIGSYGPLAYTSMATPSATPSYTVTPTTWPTVATTATTEGLTDNYIVTPPSATTCTVYPGGNSCW